MTETPELSIYEKAFAKSDKTDAILVVDGKKLHVNKAYLSYHSDYFKTLFNSEFKEKSMEEIEIKDVKFEDFATVLSLVQNNPILPNTKNYDDLLTLADRFLLPAAKRHLELFICSTNLNKTYKLGLADQYDLDVLRDHAVALHTSQNDFEHIHRNTNAFSDRTKSKLFDRYVSLVKRGEIFV